MKKKAERRGRDGARIARESMQRVASGIEWQKRKELEFGKENEETKIRREINQFILAKAFEGRNKEDILKRLKFMFHAEKYKPYWKFFEAWTDGAIQKRSRTEKAKSKAENSEAIIETESKDESER